MEEIVLVETLMVVSLKAKNLILVQQIKHAMKKDFTLMIQVSFFANSTVYSVNDIPAFQVKNA